MDDRNGNERADRRRLLRIVMLAVFVWGSILALGTTLYGYDPATGDVRYSPNIVRGLIVEACVLGLLGLWVAALARRRSA